MHWKVDAPVAFRWKLLIYIIPWVVAGSTMALRSDDAWDDYFTEAQTRWITLALAPLYVSMGLDFAVVSMLRQGPGNMGGFTILFLVAFLSHALFTLASHRRLWFLILIAALISVLVPGVSYALRYFHLERTLGHG